MHPVTDCAEQMIETRASPASAVTALVVAAAGRRDALEEARDGFIDRLHRASDDYVATGALHLIYAAINTVDTGNTPERVPAKPARRWSQRTRAARRLDARRQDRDRRVARRAAATATMNAKAKTPGPERPARRDVALTEGAPGEVDTDPWALHRAADDGWSISDASTDRSAADAEAAPVLAGQGGNRSRI